MLRDAAVRQNLRLQVLRTSGGEATCRGRMREWGGTVCAGPAPPKLVVVPTHHARLPLCFGPHNHAAGSSSQATRERICGLFTPGGPLAGARSAIVYCAFKEDANQVARMLGARGVTARAYHAGKDYRVRAGRGLLLLLPLVLLLVLLLVPRVGLM